LTNVCSDSIIINVRRKKEVSTDPLDRIYMVSNSQVLFRDGLSEELKTLNYENFIKSRHSIRHFGSEAVDVELLREAIQIAQYTPSACNRQGWVIRIVESKDAIDTILENQNGNRGFGHEIDKLVMITCDVRAFQKNRELFQPYIDGGMYAQSVLNALYYKGIGAIPLSASLAGSQEKK